MICENCKERPASVTITKGYIGESVERNLCEKCAFQSEAFSFNPNEEPLSIQQFLSHWFGEVDPQLTKPKIQGSEGEQLACSICHLTFNQFLDIGKFGCATCYETFREQLPLVFGKLHNGRSVHTGKIPASFNKVYAIKRKIEEIRTQMQLAVAAERFEEAAALRDEAKELQHELAQGEEDGDVD